MVIAITVHCLHHNRQVTGFTAETEQLRERRVSNLCGILFAETVYSLWIQRNESLLGPKKTEDQMLHQIIFRVAC